MSTGLMTRRQYYVALMVVAVTGLLGGMLGSWIMPGRAAWAQEEGRAEETDEPVLAPDVGDTSGDVSSTSALYNVEEVINAIETHHGADISGDIMSLYISPEEVVGNPSRATPALMKFVEDQYADVRARGYAVRALGLIGDASCFQVILQASRSDQYRIAGVSIEALGNLALRGLLSDEQAELATDRLLQILWEGKPCQYADTTADVAGGVRFELPKLPSFPANAISGLLHRPDKSADQAHRLIDALAYGGADGLLRLAPLLNHGNPQIRTVAAEAAFDVIQDVLDSRALEGPHIDVEFRHQVSWLASSCHALDDLVSPLANGLTDQMNADSHCARALLHMTRHSSLSYLPPRDDLAQMSRRSRAILAVHIPMLRAWLDDLRSSLRDDGVDAMAEALRHTSDEVRKIVLQCLEEIDSPRSTAVVQAYYRSMYEDE